MWVLASLSVDLNIPLGVGKHFETISISTALSLESGFNKDHILPNIVMFFYYLKYKEG